jgi:Polymerase beta, Nucleotidyltransferase
VGKRRGESAIQRHHKKLRVETCLLWRRFAGPTSPELTEQQRDIIRGWAQGITQISEVRLFGSRAVGCARADSDIDLAVTLDSADPDTVRGVYFAAGNDIGDLGIRTSAGGSGVKSSRPGASNHSVGARNEDAPKLSHASR